MCNYSLSDKAKLHVYLGNFCINYKTKKFEWFSSLRRFQYIDLGEIVYFMYVNNELSKIGAAGGAGGWYTRCEQYKKGYSGDFTNKLIYNKMKEIGESRIDVWGIPTPEIIVQVTCSLTGKDLSLKLSKHKELEKHYTAQYLAEHKNNRLFLSKQIK